MDSLRGLIAKLEWWRELLKVAGVVVWTVVGLLVASIHDAHAVTYGAAQPLYAYAVNCGTGHPGNQTATGNSCSALGNAVAGVNNSACGATFPWHLESTTGGAASYGCNMLIRNTNNATFAFAATITCPTGYTLNAPGLGPNGATCTPNVGTPDPGDCGSHAGETAWGPAYFDMGTSQASVGGNNNACTAGGCVAVFQGTYPEATRLQDGITHYYGYGSFITQPHSCSSAGSPTPLTTPPANDCGPGEAFGQVNGRDVCVDNRTGEEQDPHDENNNGKPDGCEPGTFSNGRGGTYTRTWSASTNTCTTTGDPDGAGSSPSQPPCVGMFCGDGMGGDRGSGDEFGGGGGNGDGGGGGDDEEESPGTPFCEENPQAIQCLTQAWSGTCSAGFTCDGDAVFCAIAQQQHESDCKLFVTSTPLATLGAAVAAGEDPLSETLPKPSNAESVAIAGMIDTTEIFGASCPADISFTIGGQSATIDLSNVCTFMGYLGLLWVASCALVGMMIIGRG